MAEYNHIRHTFAPVYNRESRVLILGSLPSVKSRQQGFYYGHPRNRFWQVLAALFHCEVPAGIDEKKELLLTHHVGVWDVIAECDIMGSADSSIKNVIPADIEGLLRRSDICRIFANGNTAGRLYRKYVQDKTGREIIVLPSTSPANAAFSLDRLTEVWSEILK